MSSKMNKTRFCIAAIVIFALTLGASAAVLQDATPTNAGEESTQDMQGQTSPIVCESSLVLLVGLAQRDYGYQLPENLADIERGQYEGYFGTDGQTGADGQTDTSTDTDTDTSTEGTAQQGTEGGMTTEATPESDMMTTPDAGQGQTQPAAVLLNPPLVLDEDVRCTELRASVEDFFMQQSRQFSGSTG